MGTLRRDQRPLSELVEDYAGDDVRDAAWYRFVEELRTLRASRGYVWADVALATIARDVQRTQRVRPWHRRMVDRILASERAPSRDFDVYGFGRRW
jgi:hypothetical protein